MEQADVAFAAGAKIVTIIAAVSFLFEPSSSGCDDGGDLAEDPDIPIALREAVAKAVSDASRVQKPASKKPRRA